MKVFHCVQLSPAWWEARRGIPTASCFEKILTPTGKLSAQADDYIAELIADIAALHPTYLTEQPMTAAMRQGRDTEPEARRWFEMDLRERRGRAGLPPLPVRQVGFCTTDDGRFGCSPDALIGEDDATGSVLELKCPLGKTHARYLLSGELPADYRPQVHGHLLVTGRPYVDFCSYSPGLPPFVVRVEPDAYTVKLRAALDQFWEKFEAAKARIAAL